MEEQREAPQLERPPHVEAPQFEAPQVEHQRFEPPAAEAPRYEERRPEPKPIDPKVLLEDAGLVMVETDRSKAPPLASVAEEPQSLGRPKRDRPRPATPQEDELVQIETTRK